MNNIIRLSIVLAIVTLVAAFVLAEIYSVTKPRIELQKRAKTEAALRFVLPSAQVIVPNTSKVPVKDSDGNTLYEKDVINLYKGHHRIVIKFKMIEKRENGEKVWKYRPGSISVEQSYDPLWSFLKIPFLDFPLL